MKHSRFLSRVFYGAAFTFMGIHWGSYALVTGDSEAELTDEIAAAIGVSKEYLQDYTKSKFLILDPAHEKTRRFFEISLNTPPAEDFVSGTSMNAQARQDPVYGYGSLLNKISGGITGALQPCLVLLNPQRITLRTVAQLAFPDYADQITHLPGADEDYLKIVTLHELEHCRHVNIDVERLSQEYHADRRALQTFLKDGGDAAVVRAWIGARSMATLRNALMNTGNMLDDPYTMAPALYDELVLGNAGDAPVGLEKLQSLQMGYDEAAYQLLRQATRGTNAELNLRNPKTLYQFSKRILRDPSIKMSEEARSIIQLTFDTYEFLARPAAKKPLPTPLPVPGVS
jgi:hypothetical protein